MDTVKNVTRLFVYDAWANREVLACLRAAAKPPAKSLKALGHIFSAERLWLDRLLGKKPSVAVWPEFTLQDCIREAADLPVLWTNYLAANTEADLANLVSYQNSLGEEWSSRKDDILMHVIMHAAYHRGQIATDMRAAGLKPAYTDFIHSIRQGLVE